MINFNSNYPPSYQAGVVHKYANNRAVSFCGSFPVETIKHYNIGIMSDGFIGKVRAKTADGKEVFLNLFKHSESQGKENYKLKDLKDNLIGEMNIKIKKFFDYNRYEYTSDPSHVFVDEIRNYSHPNTPYHNPSLEEFKEIGVRLMQIAQRRSDEARCCGNIELISKNESKGWYKNVLGLREKYPPMPNNQYGFIKFNIRNPNHMYLPPESKEPLSRLYGGL